MSEAIAAHEPRDRTWSQRLANPTARYLLGVGALAGLYYAGAKTGYVLEFSGPVAAIVWLPVGVGISFLYLGGLRFWPGVLIGDLLANSYSTLPIGSALGQTVGNMLEVILATVLLRRLVRRGSPLDSIQGVGAIVVAIAAGAAVSATIGVSSLLSGGVVHGDAAPTVWRTWWLGDASGALIVVPLALAWYGPLPRHWTREAHPRGCAPAGDHRRPRRVRLSEREPGDVPRLPDAYVGGASLRPARRDDRRCDDGPLHRLAHHPLHRPVPLRVGHAQRAQRAAFYRGRRPLGALPCRSRQRAGADRDAPEQRLGRGSSRRPTTPAGASSTTSTTARSSA